MKRIIVLAACALCLGACSGLPFLNTEPAAGAAVRVAPPAPVPARAADGTARVAIDGVDIEKVAFRAGVSSATVERMARQRQCLGGLGAGLVTPPGPVEVYRMACDNGKVFLARCELRQCKPM